MEFAKTVYFADAYMPDTSDGVSHETVSILNMGEETALVSLTLYFEDREPMEGFRTVCGPQRTTHYRLDKAVNTDGKPIPRCTPYAIKVESSVSVLIQYTRVDATRPGYSLMTVAP